MTLTAPLILAPRALDDAALTGLAAPLRRASVEAWVDALDRLMGTVIKTNITTRSGGGEMPKSKCLEKCAEDIFYLLVFVHSETVFGTVQKGCTRSGMARIWECVSDPAWLGPARMLMTCRPARIDPARIPRRTIQHGPAWIKS